MRTEDDCGDGSDIDDDADDGGESRGKYLHQKYLHGSKKNHARGRISARATRICLKICVCRVLAAARIVIGLLEKEGGRLCFSTTLCFVHKLFCASVATSTTQHSAYNLLKETIYFECTFALTHSAEDEEP